MVNGAKSLSGAVAVAGTMSISVPAMHSASPRPASFFIVFLNMHITSVFIMVIVIVDFC